MLRHNEAIRVNKKTISDEETGEGRRLHLVNLSKLVRVTLIDIPILMIPERLHNMLLLTLFLQTLVQARPRFPGAYGLKAASNLSSFRSNILAQVSSSFEVDAANDASLKYSRFDRYPVTVSCPPDTTITRFGGQGDGGKRLCNLTAREPCLIFSLGSRLDFTFERDVLATTPCVVHTFDCTENGSSIDPRHHYHKWCLGSNSTKSKLMQPDRPTDSWQALLDKLGLRKEKAKLNYQDLEFYSWQAILDKLGHTDAELHLLKVDIEGFEYQVLGELKESDLLPTQLALEVHFSDKTVIGHMVAAKLSSQMSLLFFHLASLGYAIISREDNPFWNRGCCSEFSFLLVEDHRTHEDHRPHEEHFHKYAGRRGKKSAKEFIPI
eukprot:g67526.t1